MNGPAPTDIQGTGHVGSVAVVVALLLAHFLFRPVWIGTAGTPDLLMAGLLLASLRLRAGPAAGLGFSLGFLEAAMALANPGPYALVYTIAAYVSARSRDLLFADARFYIALYLFAGTWVARASLILLVDEGPGTIVAIALASLTAATTALIGVAANALATPFMR